jgi:hypothetical protein
MAGVVPSVVGQTGQYGRLATWVADAHDEICHKWGDWRFLWQQHQGLTLTAGVRAYQGPPAVPDDLSRFERTGLYLNKSAVNYRPLRYLEWPEFQSRYDAGAIPSTQPAFVSLRPDRTLVFDTLPPAADVFSAYYYRRPARLTANTDTPEFPATYEHAIIARTKIFYAEFENAPEVLQAGAAEYALWVQRLEDEQRPEYGNASWLGQSEELIVSQPQ